MSREIHTQANGNDQSVTGDHIYSQAPEVHEPGYLNNGSKDAEDDKTGSPEASKENYNCDENCDH